MLSLLPTMCISVCVIVRNDDYLMIDFFFLLKYILFVYNSKFQISCFIYFR